MVRPDVVQKKIPNHNFIRGNKEKHVSSTLFAHWVDRRSDRSQP
jgi:hypothetical protein